MRELVLCPHTHWDRGMQWALPRNRDAFAGPVASGTSSGTAGFAVADLSALPPLAGEGRLTFGIREDREDPTGDTALDDVRLHGRFDIPPPAGAVLEIR